MTEQTTYNPTATQCKGTTTDGERCKRTVKSDNQHGILAIGDYCHDHRDQAPIFNPPANIYQLPFGFEFVAESVTVKTICYKETDVIETARGTIHATSNMQGRVDAGATYRIEKGQWTGQKYETKLTRIDDEG